MDLDGVDAVLSSLPVPRKVDQTGVSVTTAMEAGMLHQEQNCSKTNILYCV